MPQTPAAVTRGTAGASWMAAGAKSQDLLYVSSGSDVVVYSYPKLQYEGTLGDFVDPWGLCSDKAGDVCVTDAFRNTVVEYAHGGSQPIWTLSAPKKGVSPVGCAVDPTTGNLAVTSTGTLNFAPGNLTLYPAKHGKGVIYNDPDIAYYGYCGYDGKGDLFLDAVNNQDYFAIDELPHGGSSLIPITLNYTPSELPAGVQWAGNCLIVILRAAHRSTRSFRIRALPKASRSARLDKKKCHPSTDF